jgi:4-hydroxybenzoate polyprenyltransferase
MSDGLSWTRVLSDFLRFIRIETSLVASSIALTGYLLFNQVGPSIVPLFLSVLLMTASSYMVNHITDRKEDEINNKRVSRFAVSRLGTVAVFLFASSSVLFSLFLGSLSAVVLVSTLVLSHVYSVARIKALPLKNVYSGLVASLAFLVGAFVGGFSPGALAYVPFFVMTFFLINLAGDIRGYRGDLEAGIMTIPVMIGYENGRVFLHSVMASFAALSVAAFPSVFPFAVVSLLFAARGRFRMSRASFFLSLVSLPVFVMALRSNVACAP